MVPQNPEMNRGVWAQLESAVRGCTSRQGELYVLTGPVFNGRARFIGSDRVSVPNSLYKVVVSGSSARAFVLPNRTLPKTSDFSGYEATVDALQVQTGLTFFPAGGVTTSARGSFCTGNFGG